MTKNKKLLLVYLNSSFFLLLYLAYCLIALAYEHSPASLQHLQAAKMYVGKELYEQAKLELEAGLKDDPKSPDILNNLGNVYLRLQQCRNGKNKSVNYLEKAREYFTQALDIDPDFPAAWNGLADIYYLTGNTQQAISYYKKALSLSPVNAFESQTNLANAERDLGLLDEAQASYEKAIEFKPLYAPAHNGYAELLLKQNELARAYSEILEAVRLKPNYATAYYNLGLLESSRGNKLLALKAYLLSLRYETNSNYAHETQTLINRLGLNNNQVSVAELKRYQSELCQSLGISEPKSETQSPALSFEEASSISNKFTNTQASIATIEALITSRKWSQAQEKIAGLLKTHPDDPVLLNELGLVFFNQKKYLNAEKVLRQAITNSNNKLAAAYYNLGQTYLSLHDLVKAQSALEKAKSLSIKQHENSALINNALAILLKQKGDLKAARCAYNEAIKYGGDNYPVIHYNLAILLEKMDKPQEAAAELNTYLRLAPNGLNAQNAQNHLKKIL